MPDTEFLNVMMLMYPEVGESTDIGYYIENILIPSFTKWLELSLARLWALRCEKAKNDPQLDAELTRLKGSNREELRKEYLREGLQLITCLLSQLKIQAHYRWIVADTVINVIDGSLQHCTLI